MADDQDPQETVIEVSVDLASQKVVMEFPHLVDRALFDPSKAVEVGRLLINKGNWLLKGGAGGEGEA